MQNEIHLSQQIRQRLGFAAKNALSLKNVTVLDRPALLLQMLERLDEKAASAAGRIENDFAELGIDDFYHEAYYRTRRVEFARIAGGITHLFQHGLVEMTEGVDLVTAGKVNVRNFVDHVAQQVSIDHPVDRALEDRRDHVAPVAAIGTLQAAQISEQAGTFAAVRPGRFFVVHETDQLITRDAVRFRRPVAPAIRRFERGTKTLTRHLRFLLGDLLHVVQEFKKHDPREHRQPVEIAVEPLVLAHNIAAGLHDGGKPLCGGERLCVLLCACHELFFRLKELLCRL